MNDNETKKRFHVISGLRRADVTAETFLTSNTQSTLFPTPRPGLVIFVFFPEVTEEEFRITLEIAKPGIVVELRNTPRFDIGKLNRQLVFQYFDSGRSTYLDLTSQRIGQANWPQLLEDLKRMFNKNHIHFDKPIMFLLSTHNSPPEFSDRIIDVVAAIKKSPPEVLNVPRFVDNP